MNTGDKCGTSAGYYKHYRERTSACEACKQAHRERQHRVSLGLPVDNAQWSFRYLDASDESIVFCCPCGFRAMVFSVPEALEVAAKHLSESGRAGLTKGHSGLSSWLAKQRKALAASA